MASAADIARIFEKSVKKLKARDILLRKALICAYRYAKENNNDLENLTKQFELLYSRFSSLPTREKEYHWQQLLHGATPHGVSSNKDGRHAHLVADSHPPLADLDCDGNVSDAEVDVAYVADSASSSPAASSSPLAATEQSTPGTSRAALGADLASRLGAEVDVTSSPALAPLKLIVDSEGGLDSSFDDRDLDVDSSSSRLASPTTSEPLRLAGRSRAADFALPASDASAELRQERQPSLPAVESPSLQHPAAATDCRLSDSAAPSCESNEAAAECGVRSCGGGRDAAQLDASPSHSAASSDAAADDPSVSARGVRRRRRLRRRRGSRSALVPTSGAAQLALDSVEMAVAGSPPPATSSVEFQVDETALCEGSTEAPVAAAVSADQAAAAAAWAGATWCDAPAAMLDAPVAAAPPPLLPFQGPAQPTPPRDSELLPWEETTFHLSPPEAACASEAGSSEVISPAVKKLAPVGNVERKGATGDADCGGGWTSRGKKRLHSKQSRLDSFFFDHEEQASSRGGGSSRMDAPARSAGRGSWRAAKMRRAAAATAASPAPSDAEDFKENVPPQWPAVLLDSKAGRTKASKSRGGSSECPAATCEAAATEESAFDPDETVLHSSQTGVAPEYKYAQSITAGLLSSAKQCSISTSPRAAVTVQKSCRAEKHQRTPPSGKISLRTSRHNGLLGSRLATRESPAGKPTYVYSEVVRGKKRLQLKSYSCRQCLEYFSAMNLPEEEQKKRLDQVCRHRGQKKPPQTPTGFWDIHLDHTE